MSLRTKFTLVMTSLVLFVVAVLSCVFASQLLEQLIQETDARAGDLAEQIFVQAKHALVEGAQQGLRTQFVAAKENPLIYQVSITDTDGIVLASTDENLPGTFLPRRASLSHLVGRSFLHQMKILQVSARRTDKNPQLFEHDYAFSNGNKPFGEVRVVVDPALLVPENRSGLLTVGIIVLVAMLASALLAAVVGGGMTLDRRSVSSAPSNQERRDSEVGKPGQFR